jgi:outer membrane immunogenic protein
MKRQLLLGVAIGALVAVNSAVAAPPAVPYSWTGCYIGGNIGYSWGRAQSEVNAPGLASFGLPTLFSATQDLNGVIGGGQIGCNWRASPSWIWGLETDFQGSGEKGSSSYTAPFVNGEGPSGTVSQSLEARIRWFGTIRARLGFLITPWVMLYGTGGFAYGNVKFTDTVSITGFPTTTFGGSTTRPGWTVGAGVEGAIPNTTNWTWKVEYLYVDLGNLSGTGVDPTGGIVGWSTRVTDNIVRFGINYRFTAWP